MLTALDSCGRPVRGSDHTGKPVLHIISQGQVNRRRRADRSACHCAVVALRVAALRPSSRETMHGGRLIRPAGSYTVALRAQEGDLLPFGERKVAP
jgi:hypothetical protein